MITADYTFRAVYVSNLTLNFAYLLACTTYEFTTVGKRIQICITYENFRKSYRIAGEKISLYSS